MSHLLCVVSAENQQETKELQVRFNNGKDPSKPLGQYVLAQSTELPPNATGGVRDAVVQQGEYALSHQGAVVVFRYASKTDTNCLYGE